MSYGISDAGFVRKTLAEIRQEMVDKAKIEYGETINVQPEGVLGQVIDIMSERLSLLWEQQEADYYAKNPDSATGVNLDMVCNMVGVIRLAELNSTVTATLVGDEATIIPAGTQFQVGSDENNVFETDSEVTIPVGLTIDVDCTNLVAGAKICEAGTLTTIKTPIAGLTSVTNASDGVIGRLEETDAELRIRRREAISQSGGATIETIRAALLEVDGVTQAKIYENTTTGTVDGRPAHSFECVVIGGSDDDLASTIWLTKPAGIATHGTTTETLVDSQGTTRTIKFSRPAEVDIYVEVNITAETGALILSSDVVAAIEEYAATLEIGSDVLPISGILATISRNVSGIRDIEVLADDAAAPTTSTPIVIDETELAVFDETNIEVNIV